MNTTHRIPIPAAGIIWRQVNDGAVLVAPEAGTIRVLNELGAQIWRLLDGQTDISTIEKELIRHYDVTPEQLHQDVEHFLVELAGRGLLTWKEPS